MQHSSDSTNSALHKDQHFLSGRSLHLKSLLVKAMVRILYVFLFAYTGYSKLFDHASFTKGLSKVPVLGHFSELLGWGAPILELTLAIGMILPKEGILRVSFKLSVILMGIFTLYLLLMVSLVKEKLCHCGGVIGSLGWWEHLVLNVIILILGIWTIRKK